MVGEDASQVPLDPPQFMLASLSIIDGMYHLWRVSIPYGKLLMDDVEYDKFSETHLMSALIQEVCIFSTPFSFILLFLYFCT